MNAKGEPIVLTPRHPKEQNDKTKNKKPVQKVQPSPLLLQPKVQEDQLKKKQTPPPTKADQGTPKKQELPALVPHPKIIGAPVKQGELPKGTTRLPESQRMLKKPTEDVKVTKEVY